MAALQRAVKLKPLLKSAFALSRPISTCKVLRAEWNYNWTPDKAPKTKEELEAASAKYGLVPEDYKPFVNSEGQTYGDYPEMPYIGEPQKDPFWNWDDPVFKRDLHEPVHIAYEALMSEKADPARHIKDPVWVMWGYFLGATALICFLILSTMPYGMNVRKYQTWYPYENEKPYELNGSTRNYKPGGPYPSYARNTHYTFEPAE